MKHTLSAILVMATLLFALPGCSSDDDFTTETSSDCIVTSASLGKLIRILHTTGSKGQDSTYTEQVTGSYYPMYIDQLQGLIYNGDSLPTNVDLTRITFDYLTSTGTLAIRKLNSEEDTLFNAADTTDFSQPRLLTVIATDGTSKRTYKVQLNMHKEESETFRWQRICTQHPALVGLEHQHSIAANGRLYVFGTEAGMPYLFTATAAHPEQWERHALKIAGESSATAFNANSVQHLKGTFYAMSNGRLVRSTDAINWENVASDLTPEALVGAGSNHLVAIADDQLYTSYDGNHWTMDKRDTDGPLPTEEFASNCIPSTTDPTFEDILLIGLANGVPAVWKHNIDLTGGESFAWTYYPAAADNPYNCPTITSPSLFTYDNASLLVGLGTDQDAIDFYTSRDNGRTWKKKDFECPKEMTRPTSISAFADKDNFIWLVCGGTGEVWRGRLNRLGWQTPPTSFLKQQQP